MGRGGEGVGLVFRVGGRNAPTLADLGFHPIDYCFFVFLIGEGFGGAAALAVFPTAVTGCAGELGELVEGLVAAGDFGAYGAVDCLGELAAVLGADFFVVHLGMLPQNFNCNFSQMGREVLRPQQIMRLRRPQGGTPRGGIGILEALLAADLSHHKRPIWDYGGRKPHRTRLTP
jgi:hypothetical protein